jgi:hypothetical protein
MVLWKSGRGCRFGENIMGYIKHSAIIVTNWDFKKLQAAHEKAKEIFKAKFTPDVFDRKAENLVSDIVHGITNSQASFFIAPDGSKEGWADSDKADEARKEFLDWLYSEPNNYSNYIEINFGGDDKYTTIVRTKDTDLETYEER